MCCSVCESLDEGIVPDDAPILNPILDKIKVGLTALKVTVQDAGPNPLKCGSIVASVNTNLAALYLAAQTATTCSMRWPRSRFRL